MLKGRHVLLRPMKQEDVVRQHEFNQDPELYGLDSTYPRVSRWNVRKPFTTATPGPTRTLRRSPSKPTGSTSAIAR